MEDFKDKKDNSWEYGITWEELHNHYKDEVHAIVSEYWDSLSAEEQYQIIEKEKDSLSRRVSNLNYALNKMNKKE